MSETPSDERGTKQLILNAKEHGLRSSADLLYAMDIDTLRVCSRELEDDFLKNRLKRWAEIVSQIKSFRAGHPVTLESDADNMAYYDKVVRDNGNAQITLRNDAKANDGRLKWSKSIPSGGAQRKEFGRMLEAFTELLSGSPAEKALYQGVDNLGQLSRALKSAYGDKLAEKPNEFAAELQEIAIVAELLVRSKLLLISRSADKPEVPGRFTAGLSLAGSDSDNPMPLSVRLVPPASRSAIAPKKPVVTRGDDGGGGSEIILKFPGTGTPRKK